MRRLSLPVFTLAGLCLLAAACSRPGRQAEGTAAAEDTGTGRRRIPVEDFFRLPERSKYTLSPDGRLIAYLAPWQGRPNLFVQSVGGADSARRVTAEAANSLSEYRWAGSDRLIYLMDSAGDQNPHLYTVRADGVEKARDLTPFPRTRVHLISAAPDSGQVLLEMNRSHPERFDVFRLRLADGALTLVAPSPGGAVETWMVDHAGRVRGMMVTQGPNQTMLYRDGDTGPFRKLLTTHFKDYVSPMGFTPDDRRLYVISDRGRDKAAVCEFDPKTARETQIIFESKDVDVEHVDMTEHTGRLRAAVYETATRQVAWLMPAYARMDTLIQAAIGTPYYAIASADRTEQHFILQTYGDRTGGAWYYYDRRANRARKLAESTPWLKEDELAHMRPIQFLSRDSLLLHGYLTLPIGTPGRNLPVVINPHAGPQRRDSWGYSNEVQFLANRGYAVLQVNYRGSTGYGRAFYQASFKQWGRKMQDDLSDGLAYLKREGIADTTRVAIYGNSYGGYAALAGLAFTPRLYACGIDYAGNTNLFSMINDIPPYWQDYREMDYETVGHPVRDSALLAAASPALHVDRIRAPLLIAHGRQDPYVSIKEVDAFVQKLKAQGTPVEYMVKDDEGHGFVSEPNRFAFYHLMEQFLSRNIGPARARPHAKANAQP